MCNNLGDRRALCIYNLTLAALVLMLRYCRADVRSWNSLPLGCRGGCDNPIGLLPAALDVALLYAWAAFTILCRGFLNRAEQLQQQAGCSPQFTWRRVSWRKPWITGGLFWWVWGSPDEVLWASSWGREKKSMDVANQVQIKEGKTSKCIEMTRYSNILATLTDLRLTALILTLFLFSSIILSTHRRFSFLAKTAKTPPTHWQLFFWN